MQTGGCAVRKVKLVAAAALLAAGCSRPAGPIFEPQDPPIAWPASPAAARIRYVGQISSSADLKPPRRFLQSLGNLLIGPEKPEQLYGPRSAICAGRGRRLWVADPGGRRVHVFDMQTRSYQAITRAGETPLLSPVDVCAGPDQTIYVCDSENAAIYRFAEPEAAFQTELRMPEELQRPAGVHYDHDTGELYVVDAAAHDVKVLGPDGTLRRILGRRGAGPGEFNFPCGITVHNGLIWIVDAGNHRVQGLEPTGAPVATVGQAGDAPGDLALPKGIAFDSDGHAYVVDARFENVQVFGRDGSLLLFFGQEGTGPGEFWLPAGIHIDATDRIWICDSYNGRVQVFQYVAEQRLEADDSDGEPAR